VKFKASSTVRARLNPGRAKKAAGKKKKAARR